MLIKEYEIDIVINSLNGTFSMSYPQILSFINSLIEKNFIQKVPYSLKFSLTENGKEYLKQFGLLNRTIKELNDSVPEINEDFYYSYFKK